ncbi:MAG: 5-(carboxyamino)imidazole ribonucleotide synthase [Balneolaceae bacterium]
MRTTLPSDFTIGFLGAGQLARMSALQAFRFGMQVAVLSDRPNEKEPVTMMTPHVFYGSFDDADALLRFAEQCDVITLENEFIPSSVLFQLREKSGTPIYPSPETFARIENKWIEKKTFEDAGIEVAPYALITSVEEMNAFGELHGWPFLLKSSKGGYDGYGNRTVRNIDEAGDAFDQLGGSRGHDIVAEAFVAFTHELAVQVAANEQGHVVYPCVETVQKNHICVAVTSPAPVHDDIQKEAQRIAVQAVEAIEGKGVFAFEFFLTTDNRLVLNESAPRPHNSGHYTIEGVVASQFENHVRAVSGLPLGSTERTAPAAVMINLLGTHNRPAVFEHVDDGFCMANGHLHHYGKTESKIGRKMGHYTLLGDDVEQLLERATKATMNIHI